jgi:uncharacterized protein
MGLLRRTRRRRPDRDGHQSLFFATDLHASEICFRKFVAAAAFYQVDTLILGGDTSGKLLIPIVYAGADRWTTEVQGRPRTLRTEELDGFEREARAAALYTWRMDPEEHAEYTASPATMERLFERAIADRLRAWIHYAHEKLTGTDVIVYAMPGNDDPAIVDDVFRAEGGDRVRFVEGEVVEVAPGHELLSTGYTNVTPWRTHREYGEDEIADRIRSLAGRLTSPATAIFNLHVPPYNSTLDTAPLLGQDLKVKSGPGGPVIAPVGSTAVRAAIEEHQPLLSLHGHIHESGGSVRIGRTTVVNAGSEYGEGMLRGVLVTVGDRRLLRHQPVTG